MGPLLAKAASEKATMLARHLRRVQPGLDGQPLVRSVGRGFESYARIYEQNQELRRELQQMRAWREAALQLEQKSPVQHP